jgi:hypothetical protein
MSSETTLTREGGHKADGQGRRGICASRIAGGLLLIVGTLSLLHTTGLMNQEQAGYIIPIGFVALGAYLFMRGR